MKDLTEVYNRLKLKKSQRKDLKTSFQDELRNNARYQEILEKIAELKQEKKSIENEILSQQMDRAKLEELNIDIKSDTEMLTDIAINMLLASEVVEIVDDTNAKWAPVFSVRFKKG
jgi:predicted  nucleic acid-binding Zn-ribbon protein